MKKFLIILTLYLSASSGIFSQVHQDWVSLYDFDNNGDAAWAINVDASGNVYVTGANGFPSDIATVKYNSLGELQWAARYSGPGSNHDVGFAIAVDASGNVIVTGSSGYYADIVTIKYNSKGIEQWATRYNGQYDYIDYAYSIAIDGNGNVYVGGTTSRNGGGKDFATIKYDSLGVQQWVAIYGAGGFSVDVSYSLKVDQSGNVFVSGFSTGGNTSSNYITIKYNNDGVQQWASIYDGPQSGQDQAVSMVIDKFSNVYVTGESKGIGTNYDYATVKYNSSGERQWVARYNDSANLNDFGSSIGIDTNGNVFVTGKSRKDSASSGYDYATIKYSPSGEEQWVTRYDEGGFDYFPSLVTDVSGNVYVTGNTFRQLSFSYNYLTLKYNTDGVEEWVAIYAGTTDTSDYSYAIAADDKGNVYVTGSENSYLFTDSKYATIKYSQTITNTTISTQTPNDYYLSQNYPNPFNPATYIRYQIPESGFVRLEIFDVLGNKIETLVNGIIQSGVFEVKWDAGRYSSGTYFYKMSAGDFYEVRKMLLIK